MYVRVLIGILTFFRTAYSYRRNFIETAGGLHHVFASKVFCGWDFGIVSEHAAALNAISIYNEFKVRSNIFIDFSKAFDNVSPVFEPNQILAISNINKKTYISKTYFDESKT